MGLQFILHFVGDIHQRLHASDDHDRRRHQEIVKAASVSKKPGNLPRFWETRSVALQGRGKTAIVWRLC